MKRIIVTSNKNKNCLPLAKEGEAYLVSKGVECLHDEDFGLGILDNPPKADFCLVLGGDGTILTACRKLLDTGIPVLGVNFGHLGYLATAEPEEMREALEKVLDGQFYYEERISVKAKFGDEVYSGLNEAVIFRGAPHLIDVSININGQEADSIHADGILAATPTGSTAYNLSAGGPIIVPTAENLVITPICAHSLSARPIVVGKSDVITFTSRSTAELSVDGQDVGKIHAGDSLEITVGEKIKLIRLKENAFFKTLRKKLSGLYG